MTVYNWNQLGIEEVTNLYLYGSLNTPDNLASDTLIRPKVVRQNDVYMFEDGTPLASITLDTVSFMSSGPGYFAKASNSALIQQFFNNTTLLSTSGVRQEFSLAMIKSILGLNDIQSNISIQQYAYDVGSADFLQRSYIYNTSGFTITDNHSPADRKIKFIIEADGTRHIQNMRILPLSDNFDFDSSDKSTVLANTVLQPNIDPSNIGRRANIIFDEASKANVPLITDYYKADYDNDVAATNSWFDAAAGLAKLSTLSSSLISDLWDSGVTKFLTADNRPIIYGTNDGDTFNASIFNDSSLPTLAPYAKNGIVFIGGKGDDTFVNSTHNSDNNDIFDGGEGVDTVKYSSFLFGKDIAISERSSIPELPSPNASINTSIEVDLIVNIEKIEATSNSDNIGIVLLPTTKVQEIHAGDGDDEVSVVGSLVAFKPTIYLENGDDTLVAAPRGSIVYGGSGADTFELGSDYLIADADTSDTITYGGRTIHGGINFNTQESPWAKGIYGVRYGRNEDDELVIVTPDGRQTFIANFNFDLAGERTAGLLVGEGTLEFHRLLESPKGFNLYGTFEAIFGYYMKAIFGITFFPGIDPLILDMDGDGVELNARLGVSPFYDIDADGFAEQTGWARGDDAFLVRDLNANGIIDDVSEMFGDVSTTGFDALRVLDSNNDGVIDAADNEFSTLLLWQDVNENMLTDAGELTSLNAAGITSIDLSSTPSGELVAGNYVDSVGSFTLSDGSTREIADVTFRANQRDTIWLGDDTIDAVAATLPELKGFGTLTDLRIAMTDSASLKGANDNYVDISVNTAIAS
ncbi:MAG: hypothetical protein R3D71_10060 [Rickettsiales bacterium]